jgi:hypothetical protein
MRLWPDVLLAVGLWLDALLRLRLFARADQGRTTMKLACSFVVRRRARLVGMLQDSRFFLFKSPFSEGQSIEE